MGCFIVFRLLVSLVRRFSNLWIENLGGVRVLSCFYSCFVFPFFFRGWGELCKINWYLLEEW